MMEVRGGQHQQRFAPAESAYIQVVNQLVVSMWKKNLTGCICVAHLTSVLFAFVIF